MTKKVVACQRLPVRISAVLSGTSCTVQAIYSGRQQPEASGTEQVW